MNFSEMKFLELQLRMGCLFLMATSQNTTAAFDHFHSRNYVSVDCSFISVVGAFGIKERERKNACLKYFVIARAHVARACRCVGADTDAVRLCPPCVESGIPAAAPDHSSSSPAVRAHAYRARCQPRTVRNSCQMRLRASNRTPNKGSPVHPSAGCKGAGTARVSVG